MFKMLAKFGLPFGVWLLFCAKFAVPKIYGIDLMVYAVYSVRMD